MPGTELDGEELLMKSHTLSLPGALVSSWRQTVAAVVQHRLLVHQERNLFFPYSVGQEVQE